MKAAVIDRYGPAYSFKIREMPEPEIKDSEILVKVKASSVNPVDWKIRRGKVKLVTGMKFPKILGADFCGEVVEKGSSIHDYQKGDQVYGMVNAAVGGAYAQYLIAKPQHLAPKPNSLKAEEAASVPLAGLTALQGLRDHAQLSPEQKVLINGASGGVGTFAVQIAKSMGARVTGVCSTDNLQTVNNLGAVDVIDYTKEEVLNPQDKYHVIFDTQGNLPFHKASKCLYDEGIMVTTVHQPWNLLQIVLSKFSKHKSMKTFLVVASPQDLEELKNLVERRQLHPVLDKTYPLENIAEAHEYSQTGHARGKIAISIND
jgi:NADPH:quinone reductase-like Zn-dependent oxidoreductase